MILYNNADPVVVNGATSVTLTGCEMPELDFNEHDFILHKSVVTGKRKIVSKGTYFSARVNLRGFTYTVYGNLKAMRGATVTFYPYGTGNITIGGVTYSAPSITCLCTKAKFYHHNNMIFTDGCLLELVSEGYYELALTVAGA